MAKHWIQNAIKKPGALRRTLGAKSGKPIKPGALFNAAHGKGVSSLTKKRAVLAETLKSFHHKKDGKEHKKEHKVEYKKEHKKDGVHEKSFHMKMHKHHKAIAEHHEKMATHHKKIGDHKSHKHHKGIAAHHHKMAKHHKTLGEGAAY